MENKNYLTNAEIEKRCDDYSKHTYKCKCGHSIVIANKNGVAECNWCHNNVFKDKKIEFEYRMKQNLIKERRNLK